MDQTDTGHHTALETDHTPTWEKLATDAQTFNLEIGGGLGALKGKVWRVGLMGYSSSAENVLFFLSSLSRALGLQGCKTDLKAGVDAAMSELDA